MKENHKLYSRWKTQYKQTVHGTFLCGMDNTCPQVLLSSSHNTPPCFRTNHNLFCYMGFIEILPWNHSPAMHLQPIQAVVNRRWLDGIIHSSIPVFFCAETWPRFPPMNDHVVFKDRSLTSCVAIVCIWRRCYRQTTNHFREVVVCSLRFSPYSNLILDINFEPVHCLINLCSVLAFLLFFPTWTDLLLHLTVVIKIICLSAAPSSSSLLSLSQPLPPSN